MGPAGRRRAGPRHRGALPVRRGTPGARPGRIGDRGGGPGCRSAGRWRGDPGLRRVRGRSGAGRRLSPVRPVLAGRSSGEHRRRAGHGAAGRRGAVAHVRLFRLVRVPRPGLPGPVRGGLLRRQPRVHRRRRPPVRRRDRLRGARPAARAADLPPPQPEPAAAAELGGVRRGGPAGRPAERPARHAERLRLEPGQLRRDRPRLDSRRGWPRGPGRRRWAWTPGS